MKRTFFEVLILALVFLSSAALANSGITYQGRLMDPTGNPVTASSVQFKIQLRTPGTQNCLMYEEIQTQDLSLTKGVFSVSIGDGTGIRQDANSWSLFDALSNRKEFNFAASDCDGTPSYLPNPEDNRKFRVFFKYGSLADWEALPLQEINYIPLAAESYRVGGFPASSLLRVEDAGSLVNTTPLSNAQYTELLALLGGSSGQYEHAGELGGSALPSLGAGQTMVSDGSGGWSAALPLTSESDPTVQAFAQTALPTCTTGEALVSNGTTLSCVSVASGSLSESDIPKLTSAGNGVDGGAISGEIGGSTSVNTSGDLATTGDITAGGNVSAGSVSTGSLSTTGGITSTGDISVTGVGGKVSATNGEFRRLHLLDDQATPHYVEVKSPDPLTANYTLTLPGSLGSANQLLGMNNAGNALENKTLTAGTGVTITHSAGGIEIAASGSGGTVTSVTGTNPIIVDNSNPNTPIVSLDDSGVGVGTYGSATEVPVITVDVKGRITSASNTTISGVSPAGSNLATGKAWIGNGTGKAAEAYINVSDLKRSSDGAPQFPTTCNSGETLTWSSVIDVFTCSSITISKSQISDFPALGTAALEDVGTSAGDVIQLDPSGKLPAVDGSQLTNLPTANYDTTYFKQGGNDFSATATLGTTGNNDLNIITNNTTKMTVLANGNVGIGTSSPYQILDVADVSAEDVDPRIRITGKSTSNYTGVVGLLGGLEFYNAASTNLGVAAAIVAGRGQNFVGSGELHFQTSPSGSAPVSRMSILADGRVGIGTAAPSSMLNVSQSSPSFIVPLKLENLNATAGATTGIAFKVGSGGGDIAYKSGLVFERTSLTNGRGNLHFLMNNNNDSSNVTVADARLTITNDGNVGIGTTNPSQKLEVNGTVKATAFEGPMTSSVVGAGAGSNTTPSMTFSGDTNTGFYNASSDDTIGVTTGGTNIFNFTTNGLTSPTTGGALIKTGNGTAATPTFSFAGDPDTGWFRPAADTLAASTGGVERVRIDASGNVGIGATNPSLPLTVSAKGVYNSVAGYGVAIEAQNTNGPALLFKNGGTFDGREWSLTSVGSSNTNLGTAGNFSIVDRTANSPRVTIDSSGNVGIGTTTPTAKLDVVQGGTMNAALPVLTLRGSSATTDMGASTSLNMDFVITDSNTTGPTAPHARISVQPGGTGMGYDDEASGQLVFSTALSTNATTPNDNALYERMRITQTGNVGIGTTTPSSTLDLGGVLQLSAANDISTTPDIYMSANGVIAAQTGLYLNSGAGGVFGDIYLSSGAGTSAATPNMTIKYNGNVGIGTTAPVARLHISGTDNTAIGLITGASKGVRIGASTTGGQIEGVDSTGFGSYQPLSIGGSDVRFTISSAEMVRINSSGNVGIGTTSPSAKLDVYGNIAVSGSTVHTSDRRLKEKITPLGNSLDKILQLNGYHYYWKDKSVSARRQVGVIAQEVKAVFPDLVLQNPHTGFYSVNYEGLIPPLIESTKELYGLCAMSGKQVDQLAQQIQSHDRRISSLEKEVKSLKRQLESQREDFERRLRALEENTKR